MTPFEAGTLNRRDSSQGHREGSCPRRHAPQAQAPFLPRLLPARAIALFLVVLTSSIFPALGKCRVPKDVSRNDLPAQAEVLKDDLGRPFPLPATTPTRIVSMAPNITEILFALGLGGNVVGVTRFCDYPPEAVSIAKIGGLVDPNIERIQALAPDLVIAFRGNPLRIVNRLAALKLPVFVLDIGNGLDALYPLIARVGLVTRREKEAEGLAAGLRARQSAVESALGQVREKPRVFVVLRGQGLWTCGGGSYVNDLIARAGAVNIAAAMPKKWVLYSPERILRDDPDAIFILSKSEEDFARGREWLSREVHLDRVRAVVGRRVYMIDENSASRFGPRLVDVLDRMARALHPERFGGKP